MRDLTPEEVRAYAASLGLDVEPGEVTEATHWINALRDALGALDELDLRALAMQPDFFPDRPR